MANTENKLTDRLRLVAGVALFALGQSINFLIVAPMARAAGLTVPQFGIAFTIASLPMIFAAPFWGRRSDVLGRKPVFIIGLPRTGTTALHFLLSQDPDVQVLEYWLAAEPQPAQVARQTPCQHTGIGPAPGLERAERLLAPSGFVSPTRLPIPSRAKSSIIR